MTTDTLPANISGITDVEDATAERWLADALAPARQRAKQGPTAEAVDRMRARIFGDDASDKKDSRIAA